MQNHHMASDRGALILSNKTTMRTADNHTSSCGAIQPNPNQRNNFVEVAQFNALANDVSKFNGADPRSNRLHGRKLDKPVATFQRNDQTVAPDVNSINGATPSPWPRTDNTHDIIPSDLVADLPCDNTIVVDATNKRSIKESTVKSLQTILLIAAVFDISLIAFWVSSKENRVAESASHHDYSKLANLGLHRS